MADILARDESHFGFVGNPGVVGIMDDPVSFDWDYDIWFEPHMELGFWWDRPHPGPFSWHLIEPEKGKYDFSKADRYVAESQKRGIHILATIWPFVDWDQEYWRAQPGWKESRGFEWELPTSRYKPHDVEAYQKFIVALVERYDGDGDNDMPGLLYPVKYWEVSNEPETATWGDLNFFQGNVSDYLELLSNTYQAIKEADPAAVVLHGGAALPGQFWDDLFLSDGTRYFDIGNIHSINGPEDLHTDAFSELMKKYLKGEFWVTEVQIASGQFPHGDISEKEHAELIVKGYVTAFANGAQKVFYTVYLADSHMPPDFRGAALIDIYGKKKPAYLAFQTMVNKLEFFTEARKIATGQYGFIVDDRPVYVLWGNGDLTPEIAGKVRVTDIYGNETIQDAAEITLTGAPVFVEIEQGIIE